MTNKGYLPMSFKPVGYQNFQARLCIEEKTQLITLGLVQINVNNRSRIYDCNNFLLPKGKALNDHVFMEMTNFFRSVAARRLLGWIYRVIHDAYTDYYSIERMFWNIKIDEGKNIVSPPYNRVKSEDNAVALSVTNDFCVNNEGLPGDMEGIQNI